MKKSLIAICTLAAVCAGCSKFDTLPAGENAWFSNENLPVPIQFGNIGQIASTKAAVETLASLEPVYMLGLDTKTTKVSSWSSSSANVLLNGVAGHFGASAIETGPNVDKWAYTFGTSLNPTKKYYPLEPEFNYSFYGYYIGDQTPTVSYSGKSASVKVEMGYTDVLWAEAAVAEALTVPDDDNNYEHKGKTTDGYNARYARWSKEIGKYQENLPSMNLKHVTTRLHVIAKAKNEDAYKSFFTDKTPGKEPILTVDYVKFCNIPTEAGLTLADALAENSKKGTFKVTTIGNIQDDFDNLVPTVEGKDLCREGSGGYYFVPGTLEDTSIEIQYTLADIQKKFTITNLENVVFPNSDGTFEAGKEYKINVIFNEVMEIELVASLSNWEGGAGPTDWDPDTQTYE